MLLAEVISESSTLTLSLVSLLSVGVAGIAGLWAIERQQRAQNTRDIEQLKRESEACKLWRAEEMGARRGRHDSQPIILPPRE